MMTLPDGEKSLTILATVLVQRQIWTDLQTEFSYQYCASECLRATEMFL